MPLLKPDDGGFFLESSAVPDHTHQQRHTSAHKQFIVDTFKKLCQTKRSNFKTTSEYLAAFLKLAAILRANQKVLTVEEFKWRMMLSNLDEERYAVLKWALVHSTATFSMDVDILSGLIEESDAMHEAHCRAQRVNRRR